MCSTPVILVWLGECGVHDLPGMHSLPIQPANSTDTRVYGLSSFLQATTLEDLGRNQGGTRSTIWATRVQLAPTQGCQEL